MPAVVFAEVLPHRTASQCRSQVRLKGGMLHGSKLGLSWWYHRKAPVRMK